VYRDIHDDCYRDDVRDRLDVWGIVVVLRSVGFLIGTAFGFVVGWARLTDYDVIREMLLLRQANVFLLMMSAMVPAAVGVHALRTFNVRAILGQAPIGWTVQSVRRRHVIGSVVFGIGWAVAGTCPGPVAAQLGRGQIAAAFTIAGVLTGIVLHEQVSTPRESGVKWRRLQEGTNMAGL
jgi:uncharacterized membrane protein YedE/YeeE